MWTQVVVRLFGRSLLSQGFPGTTSFVVPADGAATHPPSVSAKRQLARPRLYEDTPLCSLSPRLPISLVPSPPVSALRSSSEPVPTIDQHSQANSSRFQVRFRASRLPPPPLRPPPPPTVSARELLCLAPGDSFVAPMFANPVTGNDGAVAEMELFKNIVSL